MTARDNRSVHISGGTVAGQISTGDGATMNQGMSMSPVGDALARVERLLAESDLPDRNRALTDLRDVREESESPEPDAERRSSALARLSERVASVSVLAESVDHLRSLFS